MRPPVARLILALLSSGALAGCATVNRAEIGNLKIVSGQMGAAALRWETAKAAVAGWEVVSVLGDGDNKILIMSKP